MKKIILITITIIHMIGCSVLTGIDSKYPSNWPAVTMHDDFCAQLTGEYINHGSATYSPKGGSPYLAYRFGFNVPYVRDLESIETVKINCIDDNTLDIQAISNQTAVLNRTVSLEREHWRIEKNTLIFPIQDESDADGLGGSLASSTFRLSISSDSSLIGEERSGGVGLVLWLIPIGGYQTFWFQWPRVTTE